MAPVAKAPLCFAHDSLQNSTNKTKEVIFGDPAQVLLTTREQRTSGIDSGSQTNERKRHAKSK
jgi:hypothetical protein